MLLGLLKPGPALGGGAASGIVPFFRPLIPAAPLLPPALAPAVPVLGKTLPGLALLASFAAGYAVGSWLWGLLNGRGQLTIPDWTDGVSELDPQVLTTIQWSDTSTGWTSKHCDSGQTVSIQQPVENPYSYIGYFGSFRAEGSKGIGVSYICGRNTDGGQTPYGLRIYDAAGNGVAGSIVTLFTELRPLFGVGYATYTRQLKGIKLFQGGEEVSPGDPVRDPIYLPDGLPEIAPLPKVPDLVPLPLPQPEPQPQPKPEPLPPQPAAPPKPGDPPKVAPPMAPPITPERPQPPKPQNPDLFPPLQPDGTPKPEKPKDPETRPPGEETTPEGIVGLPGQAPRPDLVGIAQELGKIEQKLLQLQRKPDPTVDLGPVIDLLMRLLGLIDEPYGEGQFELYPVCETDGSGQPKPPLIVQWPGGIGQINQIQSMVEALAVLHQYGKELRQPVCKTKPIGEEVTVRFLEVP